MPSSQLSLNLTEAYREKLLTLRDSTVALARSTWQGITMDDLEGSFNQWRTTMSIAITGAQTEAIRTTQGYLAAYIASETGEPLSPLPPLDRTAYVGKTRDGRNLYDALDTALIGIRVAFKRGADLPTAMRAGMDRALRMTEESVMNAGRGSLTELMDADERVIGWKRAVKGTCGACAGLADGATSPPGTPLNIHPGCQCVSEAVIRNTRDRFPRPTGTQLFEAMTASQQNVALGKQPAEAFREGDITLKDLIGTSPQRKGEDYITQEPLDSA